MSAAMRALASTARRRVGLAARGLALRGRGNTVSACKHTKTRGAERMASTLLLGRATPTSTRSAAPWMVLGAVTSVSVAAWMVPEARASVPEVGALDALHELGAHQQIADTLRTTDLDNPELAWRLARAVKNLADAYLGSEDAESVATRQALLDEALAAAGKAVASAPEMWQAHYWYGIALSKANERAGTTERIKSAFDIRAAFDEALRLNPDPNGTCYYLLGAWCFTFADMSWVTRRAASLIFATPPSSTYEEALQFFLKAEEVEPGFYLENTLMIATVYARMGDTAAAKAWVDKGMAQNVVTPEDAQSRRALESLAASLS